MSTAGLGMRPTAGVRHERVHALVRASWSVAQRLRPRLRSNTGSTYVLAEDDPFDWDAIDPDTTRFLNKVWNTYGGIAAWKLRNMTHDEPPWQPHFVQASAISRSRSTKSPSISPRDVGGSRAERRRATRSALPSGERFDLPAPPADSAALRCSACIICNRGSTSPRCGTRTRRRSSR
ncbi:DUF4065 domain-containing protein [Nocardia puris]|nr:DUF4065 domain-containing protein [Nocardia puris]MBF6364970.1 DUF4065 domain-containing protein [Nocardia puris]